MNLDYGIKIKNIYQQIAHDITFLEHETKGLLQTINTFDKNLSEPISESIIETDKYDKAKIAQIGYTSGVFDLFHIGHLNLLKNAKALCDKLIVGVTVDELVEYKGKTPLIPFLDRAEIVRSIKYVDAVVPQENMNKVQMCKKLKASILFVGDDWYNTPKWETIEQELSELGIRVIYFPYTKGVSSTKITNTLLQVRGWNLDEYGFDNPSERIQ